MPRLTSETVGTGDQSWLGSLHGIWNCRTVPIDVSSLTKQTHYPDGYIPSGFPVKQVGDAYEPWDSTSETLAGLVFTDSVVAEGDDFVNVALFDHGRVKWDRLVELGLVSASIEFSEVTSKTTLFVAIEAGGGS